MAAKSKIIDYFDADVAYFLGLLVARGQISQDGNVRRITIDFPYTNLEVVGLKKKFVQRKELLLGLQPTIRRISELTEANVDISETEHVVTLKIETLKNTMFWRNIRVLTNNKQSFNEFEIPTVIYDADDTMKKEFLRGFADVAGTARVSNEDQRGKKRVYLDVLNANWKLPVQLCHLLQDHLETPVQTITYGHPNLRDPEGRDYKEGHKESWAREHQIKVYCDDFVKINFYMQHKQEILQELADFNKKNFGSQKFCNPPKKLGKEKFKHPGERSKKLPDALRGHHYRSYWQICADLGCPHQSKCLKIFKPYVKDFQS